MQKETRNHLIIGAVILVAGIIVGLILWQWLGGVWASILAAFGVGGGAGLNKHLQIHREEMRGALQERDTAQAEKASIRAETLAAQQADDATAAQRQAARAAQGRADNGRIKEEGKMLTEAELLDKAEKGALEELEK